MLLRDVRPTPEPNWAGSLDRKVPARFPRPPAVWKGPFIALRAHVFAFGAVATVASMIVVLVIVLSNVSTGSNDSAGGGSGMSASTAKSAAPEPLSAPAGAPQSRAVKKTTAITLTTTPGEVQSV